MRKINDDILQAMIVEGKQQKDIAEHFGVSNAAISKRIKRLEEVEPPESFKSLAPKEKKFVLAKLEGKSGTASALEAFECGSIESAKVIGSRLSKDPDIQTAIDDLMHQEGIGRRVRVKRLKDVIDAKDLGIAAKGLDMANKMTGEYAPVEINANVHIAQVFAAIAEIKKMDSEIRKLTAQNEPEV